MIIPVRMEEGKAVEWNLVELQGVLLADVPVAGLEIGQLKMKGVRDATLLALAVRRGGRMPPPPRVASGRAAAGARQRHCCAVTFATAQSLFGLRPVTDGPNRRLPPMLCCLRPPLISSSSSSSSSSCSTNAEKSRADHRAPRADRQEREAS